MKRLHEDDVNTLKHVAVLYDTHFINICALVGLNDK